MAMTTPPFPVQRMLAAECLSEHSCCSFNREPARKSSPYALNVAQRETARSREMSLPERRPVLVLADSGHERPVLELKADLRI